jgi:hypothetical protein
MTDHYPSDDAIARVGLGLLDRSLPKPEWTHAAHFAATLWLLRTRPDVTPERDLRAIICAYNEATGVQNTDSSGYHETITQASIRAARTFLAERPGDEPLHLTIDALMASPLAKSSWLLSYWSKDLLFSAESRRGWIAPDLQPLPW